MTILFRNAKYRSQDKLSSRPKRTWISCHAALDETAYAPFRKEGRMKPDNGIKFNRKSVWRSGEICGFSFGFSSRLCYSVNLLSTVSSFDRKRTWPPLAG